jgi:hypothetical protein
MFTLAAKHMHHFVNQARVVFKNWEIYDQRDPVDLPMVDSRSSRACGMVFLVSASRLSLPEVDDAIVGSNRRSRGLIGQTHEITHKIILKIV